ncbi:AraC family transcriptional regulator [Flavobacterium azooxidireducens]|uniref:AraC family transcriptional regulator n=1 Tax=Flavobacterium azooxidireducens TaxID=1871076 RepID=A0ABY4KBZ5_9FLAO|nr:AraC family transcriptional regulator [Flavobacterium azooxidireducens]UPQ78306.1 AraC family transcriptional regulator [Flavobacterium azooxidireducens]
MSVSNQGDKLRIIYQLLFDLATGRRIIDLDLTTLDDDYDAILLTLLEQGERIRKLVLEQGMVPPYASFQHLNQFVFVLDNHYRIVDFNFTVVERLKYTSEAIQSLLFETLLDDSSKLVWNALLEQVNAETHFFVTTELLFLTSDGFKLPLFCTVSNSLVNQLVFVITVKVFLKDTPFLKSIPSAITEKVKAEVAVIENVHAYILEHLDAPLPSLKSLALLFGSEEHKIRNGFREHYHTSVYQFYQDERLKKAYLLIMQTDLPLKEIAYQCGFGMYLNFYKAFRKKYGFSPSVLSRK